MYMHASDSVPQAPAATSALQSLLTPVATPMMAVSAAADAGRRSPHFHHLKAMADTATALSWLAYTGPSCGADVHVCMLIPICVHTVCAVIQGLCF